MLLPRDWVHSPVVQLAQDRTDNKLIFFAFTRRMPFDAMMRDEPWSMKRWRIALLVLAFLGHAGCFRSMSLLKGVSGWGEIVASK